MLLLAYAGPLVVTFTIVLFILSMQFLWKYVDDFMGKGLPWYTLTELMIYATASFVPLALPLAVLLSSIMTMGALGENSELTPMRSAGLHLFTILKPLVGLVLLLGGLSFVFSNNVLPVANLKFHALLWDVTQKKPAMNLRPGVFYTGIDGFSIRVRSKDDDTGELGDVLIYDHRDPLRTDKVMVRARTGHMRRSTDGQYLLLTLRDGHFYDLGDPVGRAGRQDAMVHGTFDVDEVRLDLSGLGMVRTDEDLFKNNYKMLTIGQLTHSEDSLVREGRDREAAQLNYLHSALWPLRDTVAAAGEPLPDNATFLAGLSADKRQTVYDGAITLVRNQINFLDRTIEERRQAREYLARFRVEWHRKPMLAFACVIFFFIGAPLGAIIRKGGMGLPTVLAIVFFLIFHIISFSTEKLVNTASIPAFPGMWISTFVLLPMGFFITWKAATDSPLLDRDAYYRLLDRLRYSWRPRRDAHPPALP